MKQKGFTLIEMMLVLAVIAIMAMLALKTYQSSAITTRIDKASVEMQHILEAALAYNVDHQKWPDAHNEGDCEITPPDVNNAFVESYIPNQEAKSSYGTYFCWSAISGTDNNNNDSNNNTTNNQRLFWVAMKAPDGDEKIAKRIAARLPNAIVTADLTQAQAEPCGMSDCYVRAEVVQPGTTSNGQGGSGMVIATGDCPSRNNAANSNVNSSTCTSLSNHHESEYRITFNACPNNGKPRVTAFPNAVNMRMKRGALLGDLTAGRTGAPCRSWTDGNGKKKQSCDIYVHVTYCKSADGGKRCAWPDIKKVGYSAGASYMVACIHPSP